MLTADQVASVIIARNVKPWTDAMSLQKLLYYAQAWHLAVTGEPLFDEQFKAYKDGPVVPQVRHTRMEQSSRKRSGQDLTGIELDELSSNLLDLVIASYGSMSAEELSALTHAERPWLEARGDLPDDAPGNAPLSPESMARFYRAHRSLAGRTAADLAAGGVYVRDPNVSDAIDIDSLLGSLDDDDTAEDDSPWGGANLVPSRSGDRPRRPHRARC